MTLEITKNKNGNNIVSINLDNESILKIEYTKTKENGTEKLVGTATITSEESTLHVNFNIESSKNLKKVNIKVNIPDEDALNPLSEDFLVEFNSEISGELGQGTNMNTSYLSINFGANTAKLNFTEDITYTDDITINELTSDSGVCLNTMSVSEIETVLQEIVTNFRKVLPEKIELLGIDSSALGIDDETDEYDHENSDIDNSEETDTDNSEDADENYSA